MVLNYLLAIIFFLCISFSTVIFASICSRTKMRADGFEYVEYFCCRYFVEKNGECEACPNGYTSSEQTKICEPCPSGYYGARCAEQCVCQAKESCDNVRGCVVTVQPTASMFKCLPGFTLNGTKCEQCPEGRYGEKCSAKCNCDSNERCDHVTGCVPISSTEVNITHKPDEDLSDKKQRSGTDIGFYMMCIVVILLVAIIFVIVWQS